VDAGVDDGGHVTTTTLPPPGWYADPWGVTQWRWWDGAAWTGYTDQQYVTPYAYPNPHAYSATPVDDDKSIPIRAGWTALLGMVVGVVLSLAIYIVGFAIGISHGNPILLLVAQLGLWVGPVGACIIAVRRHGTGSLRDLGLRIKWVDLALGPGFAVASLIGVGIIAQVISQLGIHPRRSSLVGPVDRGTLTVVIIVLIAVVGAPIVEELFFRGLLMSGFVSRFGVAIGIILQACVFGLVHISQADLNSDLGVFLLIAPVGAVLGVLRYGFKRLGTGMVTHAPYNAIIIAVLLAR